MNLILIQRVVLRRRRIAFNQNDIPARFSHTFSVQSFGWTIFQLIPFHSTLARVLVTMSRFSRLLIFRQSLRFPSFNTLPIRRVAMHRGHCRIKCVFLKIPCRSMPTVVFGFFN